MTNVILNAEYRTLPNFKDIWLVLTIRQFEEMIHILSYVFA